VEEENKRPFENMELKREQNRGVMKVKSEARKAGVREPEGSQGIEGKCEERERERERMHWGCSGRETAVELWTMEMEEGRECWACWREAKVCGGESGAVNGSVGQWGGGRGGSGVS